jgi:hypothetical protein
MQGQKLGGAADIETLNEEVVWGRPRGFLKEGNPPAY